MKKARLKGIIPLVGSSDTFNMNPILIQNIAKSPYFQKCYRDIKDWNALVDEIYYEVKHVEPWTSGMYNDNVFHYSWTYI
jgi:pre-mRNA-splicing factor 38B